MKDTHKSTINFIYFIANFPPNFINKIWADDSKMRDHLNEKFNSIVTDTAQNLGKFMLWFYDLDQKNQIKLLEWVDENYLASNKLAQETKYYLLGEQACKAYHNSSSEEFLYEMNKTGDFCLYKYIPGENVDELLVEFNGWMDYQNITQETYETLGKLPMNEFQKIEKYFRISGYWKEDGEKIEGVLVKESDNVFPEKDEEIFLAGLTEEDIQKAIELGENVEADFVITNYWTE